MLFFSLPVLDCVISRHSFAVASQVTPWVTGNCVEILIGSSCVTFSFVAFQTSSSKALNGGFSEGVWTIFLELIWYCREQVSERGILDNSEVHKVQEPNYMSSFIIWLQEIVAFDFRFNLNDRQTQHFTSELNKEKIILAWRISGKSAFWLIGNFF